MLYLSAREVSAGKDGQAIWSRPRFEGAGKSPLLLRDYADFGPQFEIDFASVFAETAKYLALAAKVAGNDSQAECRGSREEARYRRRVPQEVDRSLGRRTIREGCRPRQDRPRGAGSRCARRFSKRRTPKNDKLPAINGWHKKGTDLPSY